MIKTGCRSRGPSGALEPYWINVDPKKNIYVSTQMDPGMVKHTAEQKRGLVLDKGSKEYRKPEYFGKTDLTLLYQVPVEAPVGPIDLEIGAFWTVAFV